MKSELNKLVISVFQNIGKLTSSRKKIMASFPDSDQIAGVWADELRLTLKKWIEIESISDVYEIQSEASLVLLEALEDLCEMGLSQGKISLGLKLEDEVIKDLKPLIPKISENIRMRFAKLIDPNYAHCLCAKLTPVESSLSKQLALPAKTIHLQFIPKNVMERKHSRELSTSPNGSSLSHLQKLKQQFAKEQTKPKSTFIAPVGRVKSTQIKEVEEDEPERKHRSIKLLNYSPKKAKTISTSKKREEKGINTSKKIKLDIKEFFKYLLNWDSQSTKGDKPVGFESKRDTQMIRDWFESFDSYIETFEPLLILESWQQFMEGLVRSSTAYKLILELDEVMMVDTENSSFLF